MWEQIYIAQNNCPMGNTFNLYHTWGRGYNQLQKYAPALQNNPLNGY